MRLVQRNAITVVNVDNEKNKCIIFTGVVAFLETPAFVIGHNHIHPMQTDKIMQSMMAYYSNILLNNMNITCHAAANHSHTVCVSSAIIISCKFLRHRQRGSKTQSTHPLILLR